MEVESKSSDSQNVKGLCLTFSLLLFCVSIIVIIFGSILGASQTFTTESECILVNKSYIPFLCSGYINIAAYGHNAPCNTTNYELLYDAMVVGSNNVERICSPDSFSSFTKPTCTCIFAIDDRIKEDINYKLNARCKPIVTIDLSDYASRVIGNRYKCWIGNNQIIALADKSHSVEIACIFFIVFAGVLLWFSVGWFIMFLCRTIKPSTPKDAESLDPIKNIP